MKVEKVAFGDFEEAFIESRFKNNVNIVFSDDNNKGKTLLFQGLMFSIGNEPMFPAGFPYQEYYFYSMLNFDNKKVEFLRKGREFVVREEEGARFFDSVSEFKYALKQYFPDMPEFSKNDSIKLVDPCLFFELFFVGQDLRDPSSTFCKYYNKTDFINVLYALGNVGRKALSSEEIRVVKEKLSSKKIKRKALKKELDRLDIDPEVSRTVLQSASNDEIKRKEESIRLIRDRISSIERALSRENNRRYKLENLLTELNSLNRKIEVGSVKCGDCGSDKIIYSSGEFEFDLTNSYVKNTILTSIKNSINLKSEKVDELRKNIGDEKRNLDIAIEDSPAELRDILLFRDQLSNGNKIDVELTDLDDQIDELKSQLLLESEDSKNNRDSQKNLLENIVSLMNDLGRQIDLNRSGDYYKGVFAVKGQTYSGSEQQVYYFCKLMGFQKFFDHNYPIIIDAFREGEISSGKENLMLDKFSMMNNQVLISATLKEEEYSTEKYISSNKVNIIDYSDHKDNKILSSDWVGEFSEILHKFGIVNNEE